MRYVVNEEKRTVVAIMEGCKYDLLEFFRKNLSSACSTALFDESLMLKDKYIGIAKCMPGDEFNVVIGKNIASIRAKEAYECDRMMKANAVINKLIPALHMISNKQNSRHEEAKNDRYSVSNKSNLPM